LGLDWTVELGDIAQQVGNRVALQVNLDPAILNAAPEVVRAEVQRIFASRPNDCRHIFNLGHGITPGVTPEAVGAAVEAVHEFGTYS